MNLYIYIFCPSPLNYNLDAETHGAGLVFNTTWTKQQLDLRQINGRLVMATFDTSPIHKNVTAAHAPRAGRSQLDKDSLPSFTPHFQPFAQNMRSTLSSVTSLQDLWKDCRMNLLFSALISLRCQTAP